jgi:hypothetical protein
LSEQLNYLSNMVIVFAVLGAGLGIKEIVASDEFKNLFGQCDAHRT